MIKCCIFDLDGTLTNTINTIEYYGNNALNKYGFESINSEEYKIMVGNGAKVLVERMLSKFNALNEENFKNVFKAYNEAYDANVYYKTEVYEGIFETLDKLKNMGVKISVVSNKPHFATVEVLKHFFGDNYFDIAFGQREGIAVKPDPVSVNEIVKMLGLKKEECLYIGDTKTDMQTGKNAELCTVGVLWGFRGKEELMEHKADYIIEKPCEIINIITQKS